MDADGYGGDIPRSPFQPLPRVCIEKISFLSPK